MRSRVPRASVARELAKFVLVGATNTLLSLLLYAGLRAIGLPYALAAAVGFAVGAVNGYVLNGRWTFRALDTARARRRYAVVQVGGLGATTGLLQVLVAAGLPDRAAYVLTVPVVTLGMFAANRGWTFAGSLPVRPGELSS